MTKDTYRIMADFPESWGARFRTFCASRRLKKKDVVKAAVDEHMARAEGAVHEPHWVPVGERMPERYGLHPVWLRSPDTDAWSSSEWVPALYHEDGDWRHPSGRPFEDGFTVTHWLEVVAP